MIRTSLVRSSSSSKRNGENLIWKCMSVHLSTDGSSIATRDNSNASNSSSNLLHQSYHSQSPSTSSKLFRASLGPSSIGAVSALSNYMNVNGMDMGYQMSQQRGFLNFLRRKKQDGDTAPTETAETNGTDSKAEAVTNIQSDDKFSTEVSSNNTTPSNFECDGASTTVVDFASNTAAINTNVSPEAEMVKFEQAAVALDTTATEAVATVENLSSFEPVWYKPSDHFITLLDYMHDLSGMNYAITIACTTAAFRILMVPAFASGQKNSSRMAHLKPEMDVLKTKVDALDQNDPIQQQQMAKQMQALFQKYECNPMKALIVPLLQAPVFMSMFFALRKMPDLEMYKDDLATGGDLWFVDLTAPDPYFVLPVVSALSFLVMMEAGKDQMMATNPQQGKMMLTFFRGLAVIMVPATMNFSTAIFCYWTTNNTISLMQSLAFKNKGVRKYFGIWDPPKAVPGAPAPKGFQESVKDYLDNQKKKSGASDMKEKIQMHNAAIDAQKQSKNSRAGRKRNGRSRGKKI